MSGGRGWKLLDPKFMAVDMMAAPRVSQRDARPTEGGRPSAEQAPQERRARRAARGPASPRPRPSPCRARPRRQAPPLEPRHLPQALKGPFPSWSPLTLAATQWGREGGGFRPSLYGEETEVQRGAASCPKTHSRLALSWQAVSAGASPGRRGLILALI